MFCMYCGQELTAGARFCHSCGHPIDDQECIKRSEHDRDETLPTEETSIDKNFANAEVKVNDADAILKEISVQDSDTDNKNNSKNVENDENIFTESEETICGMIALILAIFGAIKSAESLLGGIGYFFLYWIVFCCIICGVYALFKKITKKNDDVSPQLGSKSTEMLNSDVPSGVIVNNITVADTKSAKNKWIAFILCLLLGWLGFHRFYVGKIGTGIIYMFTLGLFGIGVVIDLIIILLGGFKDCYGKLLQG